MLKGRRVEEDDVQFQGVGVPTPVCYPHLGPFFLTLVGGCSEF